MKTALLCGKWPLAFHVEPRDESTRAETARSYLHYVAANQPLVAAKCLATEWILRGTTARTAREYFGGCGIVSTIIEALCAPAEHDIGERDAECLRQLMLTFPSCKVYKRDARKWLLESHDREFVSLDYPAFTAHTLIKRYEKQFATLVSGRPRYALVTDTAVSYLGAHRALYTRLLGATVTTPETYVTALGAYMLREYGYGLARAAYRGRNAVYLLYAPGPQQTEHARFPLGPETAGGFQWRN